MKISEKRRTEPKKVFSTTLGKLISSAGSKIKVALKTRETCFLHRKPQKLKIVKTFELSYVAMSHSAENLTVAIYARKTMLFLLKIEGGSLGLRKICKVEK